MHGLATVLVVDDNDAALELARIMLAEHSKLRCHILSAGSGEEALAMLQEGLSVDLLLLDINMPRLDGFDVLIELSNNAALAKPIVVMCSSICTGQDIARANALGAAGFVEKPPRLETLKPLLCKTPHLRVEEDVDGARLLRAA